MSEPGHEMIIVRRHEEEEHEHHSSAWKVAHADFMTAMMAFFLIMWLINVTDDQMRKGISEYFNPIHMSQGSSELKGLNKADPEGEKAKGKAGHGEKPAAEFNPMEMSPGSADTKAVTEAQAAAAATVVAAEQAAATAVAAEKSHVGNEQAGDQHAGTVTVAAEAATSGEMPADPKAREQAAFQDPYAVLAKLAEKYAAAHPVNTAAIAGDDRPQGTAGGDLDRDPFDPAYWQLTEGPPARAEEPKSAATAQSVPLDAVPDAAASLSKQDDKIAKPSEVKPPAPPVEKPAPLAASDVVYPEVKLEETKSAADALSTAIEKSVQDTIAGASSPTLSVRATDEGVLIDLTDDADFSMFEVGSAIPDGKVVVLMEKIAKALAGRKGDVIVRGYTDGRPFHSDTYDNWRLSAARAHMATYMLTRGGLDEKRILRIEGYADRSLKVPGDPLAAENRRIEILVREPD